MADETATEATVGAEVDQPKINPTTRKPWTDEDRRRQSERAKAQVARGEIGGARHGRHKKIPAYAVIAAKAQQNGSKLAEELLKIALHGQTPQLKMAAIKMLTDIEQKAKQERRDDEEHLQRLPRDQLLRAVLERVSEITGEDYDFDLPPEDVEDVGDEPEEAQTAQISQ